MAEGEKEQEKIVAGADDEKRIVLAGAGGAEEEKAIVLVGAGDESARGGGYGKLGSDGRPFKLPPGFRFRPAEDELVMYYLLPKLQGREHVPNFNIIEDNVYQSHPDKLTEKYKERGGESWYFLSPRARKYSNGRRPSRSTDDKTGRWKASTASKNKKTGDGDGDGVKVAGDGKTKYSQSTLNYYEGPIRGETKSKWIMQEITLPEYENEKPGKKDKGDAGNKDVLDQYVMCRIYVTPRPKKRKGKEEEDDDEECEYEAGPSGTKSEPAESGHGKLTEKQAGKRKRGKKPAESGQAGAASAGRAELSEKQEGKMSAEEQPLGNDAATAPEWAHHPNTEHLHLGGQPATLHGGNGNCLQATFMTTPGYYGGEPMGYHARAPMPRPSMAYHSGQAQAAFNGQVHAPRPPMGYHNGQAPMPFNGQVQVPRQAVAYNGQAPSPRQQAAYSGQVPMPRQTVGFNGQVPMPRQTVGFNGQVPVPRQQVAYNGEVNVNPPPMTVVPRTAEMQKRQETEVMHANRVLQQNLQEFRRRQSSMPPCAGAAFAAHQQRSTSFTHQQMQQQQPSTAFTHQHMQQQPSTAFAHQHMLQQQQPSTAFTHQQMQQQQSSTAFTHQQMQQHQQQPSTAFTHQQMPQQQPSTAFTHQHMQQQQQRPMMPLTHQQMQQQPQQRPTFTHQQRPYNLGANANYHNQQPGAMVPSFSLGNFYDSQAAQHYQRTQVVAPATSAGGASAEGCGSTVESGAGGEVSGANWECSNGDNMEFVESATAGGSASAADGDGPKHDSAQ